jgi:hypothetical protein
MAATFSAHPQVRSAAFELYNGEGNKIGCQRDSGGLGILTERFNHFYDGKATKNFSAPQAHSHGTIPMMLTATRLIAPARVEQSQQRTISRMKFTQMCSIQYSCSR